MDHLEGAGLARGDRVDFDRRVRLEFRGAQISSDGGLLVMSTPNRTPLSRLAMITLAEGTGRIPRGTHDWTKFLTPDELTVLTKALRKVVTTAEGLGADTSA